MKKEKKKQDNDKMWAKRQHCSSDDGSFDCWYEGEVSRASKGPDPWLQVVPANSAQTSCWSLKPVPLSR